MDSYHSLLGRLGLYRIIETRGGVIIDNHWSRNAGHLFLLLTQTLSHGS